MQRGSLSRRYFPMAGCWEIIGRIASQELRFVVEARLQSA